MFFIFTGVFVTVLRFIIAWLMPQKTPRVGDPEILKKANLSLIENNNQRYSAGLIYLFAKRLIDIVLAVLGLIITLPFFPIISYLIKKDSSGKAIITQDRIEKRGKHFTFYKFRTMYKNAELYAPAPRDGYDDRVTKIGKTLRRYSIDELPQLWNVLKGEMSIVGPRPEMPFIVTKYAEWQKVRLEVKPGITGLWQILGRKDLPLEENLEYDLYYVLNQSLFLDFAIILKTLPHLFLKDGAY